MQSIIILFMFALLSLPIFFTAYISNPLCDAASDRREVKLAPVY